MLTHIHIKDLAIVSSVELELTSGMSALTGETGAGKSILIDALGLALGDRADNTMIRAGCDRAEITAVFNIAAHGDLTQWIKEQALDDGGECILRRVLVRDSRSRGFVNGRPVPVQSLQELGQHLVDIHGQHAHQSLLRRPYQRRLLDAYAGHQGLADEVARLYREFRAVESRLSELQSASQDRAAKLDLLSFQAQELTALNMGENELDELDREHTRLSNAGRLQEISARALEILYLNEDAVQNRLVQTARDLEELSNLDTGLADTSELVNSALIQVEEASNELRRYRESLESEPALLQQTEDRLAQIHGLARKYRVRPEQLPQRLADITQGLSGLEEADSQLGQLQQELSTRHREYLSRAEELGAKRGRAAKKLGKTVTQAMQTLGMSGGEFAVSLQPLDRKSASEGGLEQVEFLVSANPGQPLQPLARVASGGELSRISLAIQVATAQCGRIPTLIFDEVDVGIGGGVAEIVGQMLRELGSVRQVLCVTHLPQVAAQGHHHLQVVKRQTKQTTHTGISVLEEDQRVAEIARMLGGVDITDHTVAHAREMVEHTRDT